MTSDRFAPIQLLDPFSPDCPEDLPCRVQDRELWFAEKPQHLEAAKQFCRACPAVAGCLRGALDRGEPYGVWGGEIFVDGVTVARKRGRGRPRKSELEVIA